MLSSSTNGLPPISAVTSSSPAKAVPDQSQVETHAAVESAGVARRCGGLDWVMRAAEAKIELARQLIWDAAPPDDRAGDTASDYKTAFSTYFDE